jgi:hypothetical protein
VTTLSRGHHVVFKDNIKMKQNILFIKLIKYKIVVLEEIYILFHFNIIDNTWMR